MKTLLTSNGYGVLVDESDMPLLAGYSWVAEAPNSRLPNNFYAKTSIYVPGQKNQSTCWMHRLLLSAPKGVQVDHINRDGLDNRRENLRLCSQSQNNANSRRKTGASGFRGVFKQSDSCYRALISSGNRTGAKVIHLGSFLTAESAALAYDSAAIKRYGPFATLNFPQLREVA